uniref:Peptidase C1A papain C-terminal domain-containing protein n=2 Tax=Tetranychus urticae TaxID=32264 RepID=T1KRL8_TETUR
MPKKLGKLVELSEENLIECSWDHHNKGCNGGRMDLSFQYVIDNKGIATESSYPYTSASGDDSGKCKYSASKRGASISSYVNIPQGNENALLQAVAQRVVSVAVDAEFDLQLYHSGVLKSTVCSPQALNHGVTVVGYGVDNGTPYWLIKNSWGADFGENGYFRLYRGNNMCGVAEDASYPVV